MIRPAKQDPEELPEEPASFDAPEALRFPPRERPTTIRRPERDAPFDLEDEAAEAGRADEARGAARERAERERESAEREQAIRQARAALQGQAAPPELAAVVWDAHEAIAAARDQAEDPDRPVYVPIARESRGFEALLPIERVSPAVYVAPYNLPERSPNPQQRPLDLVRRVGLSLLAVGLVVFGVFAAMSLPAALFGPAAAPLNPLLPAALFWPILGTAALGLAAHTWWPDQLSARRQRAVGWPVAVALASGLLWCVGALGPQPWLALGAAAIMFASSWEALRRLNLLTARTRRERWLTDAPIEAMLGWSAILIAWSVSAALASIQWFAAPITLWSSLLLLLCVVPVCIAGMTERGRTIPAVAFAWGAVWIMAARLLSGWHDPLLMVVAGLAAVVALLTALARRQEINHNERLALQGLPTA